ISTFCACPMMWYILIHSTAQCLGSFFDSSRHSILLPSFSHHFSSSPTFITVRLILNLRTTRKHVFRLFVPTVHNSFISDLLTSYIRVLTFLMLSISSCISSEIETGYIYQTNKIIFPNTYSQYL